MSPVLWVGQRAGDTLPTRTHTYTQVPKPLPLSQLPHLPLRDGDDRDPWQPVLRVMSGLMSAPRLAGLLGGLCGGGGRRRDFPFSKQLDYTVRRSGNNLLLKLPLHSPASALALTLPFSAGILTSPALSAFELSFSWSESALRAKPSLISSYPSEL